MEQKYMRVVSDSYFCHRFIQRAIRVIMQFTCIALYMFVKESQEQLPVRLVQ